MADAIGTARIDVQVNLEQMSAAIEAGKGKLSRLGEAAQTAFTQADSNAKRALTSLDRYVLLIGKSADEAKVLRATWAAGGTNAGIDALVKDLNKVRVEMQADAQVAGILGDSFAAMQVKAKAAFKDLQAEAGRVGLEEKAKAESAAMKRFADAAELAGIKAKHAADGIAFLTQRADAERINRTRDAVSVFGGSFDQLNTKENRATAAGRAFLLQVKEQEAAVRSGNATLGKAGIAFNKYGLSAKQEVAAMRQVPAQITDIFVSLQGGQNPLTVLLQQGGQLKDVFGGVRPALAGLARGLSFLLSPALAVASAFAAIGFTYGQSEKRINDFNKAIINTGQQSVLTADQLNSMSMQLDNVVGVTGRQGASALTELVATGKIAASQLLLIGEAATRMQDITGKALSETASEYAEISRDPVNAILRLNEAEGFLTAGIYARIKALQDSGDIEGAAALASETRATAQIERAQQIQDSLGLVAGAWFKIKNASGEAFDGAVNYFSMIDMKAKNAIASLGRVLQGFSLGGPAGAFAGFGQIGAGTVDLAAEAQQRVKDVRQTRLNSEAQRRLDAIRDGNRSLKERQDLEESQIINLYKQQGITKDSKVVQDALTASRLQYAKSLPKGPKAKSGAALANADASAQLDVIRNVAEIEKSTLANSTAILNAEYSARLISVDDYYAKTRQLMQGGIDSEAKSLEAQIAFLRKRDVAGKDSINVSKQIAALETDLARIRAKGATDLAILAIKEKDETDKRRYAIEDYTNALNRNVESIAKGFDATITAIKYGQLESEKQQKLTQIYDAQTEALKKLQQQKDRGDFKDDPGGYEARVAAEAAAADRAADAVVNGYERMGAAQADWRNGLNAGLEDWMNNANKIAEQISAITQRALDGTVDSLVELALTGKLTFKALVADILKELVKFFAKQAVLKFVEYFLSASGGGLMKGGDLNANGGVYNSASLSAYSGQVVSQPTAFMFAKGGALGIMGEAGSEAIMPLQRGADGKLGVVNYGGGSSGNVSLNLQLVVNSDGSRTSKSTGDNDTTTMYRKFMGDVAQVVDAKLSRAMQPGGSLWKAGVAA